MYGNKQDVIGNSDQFIRYGDSVVITCRVGDNKGYLSSTG